jgi:ribosome recycling factor
MTIDEFEDWLVSLPVQTLTDELKEDIVKLAKAAAQESSEETKRKINKEVNDFIKKYKK